MNIVQVNTFDFHGGAARANFRLHKGLRSLGAAVTMLVKEKGSDDDRIFAVETERDQAKWDTALREYRAIQDGYINRARTPISNTVFSYPYHPGYDLSLHPALKEADVINLHWIAEFLSPVSINRILSMGKPVVWTLHDMWPFTGGCHYSAACEGYLTDCSVCPLLSDDPCGLPGILLGDKQNSLPDADLTIVSPSNLLRDQAGESALFGKFRGVTIPNGLDTDMFAPMDKKAAKQQAGLPEDALILGFGTGNATEIRKGFAQLIEALHICKADERFKSMGPGKVRLVCFGEESPALEDLDLPSTSFGRIDDDARLARLYSAMDLFIQPSLEDNLPNTMLEAMSCGTPVVGFKTGGVVDTVRHEVNGLLARHGDPAALAEALMKAASDRDALRVMGRNARGTILDDHTLQVQARRYLDLYEELTGKRFTPQTDREVPSCGHCRTVPAVLDRLPRLEAAADKILAHAQNKLRN